MFEAKIIQGPSKFDNMQALFVRKPMKPNVIFTLGYADEEVKAFIDSVEAEDSSGESWNIEGRVENNKKFTAYYRTDRRAGLYRLFD